ncbi:hypothetical protein PGIGA_G00186020 [Pangasianodon gigas]|uniref:Uncharacterized protein n=1 Tax=Pangasianodon gigas TaxID=30993 RepID=A0ACC5WC45_PANGG|nr:hypothetical protein [Pangasianodon gigas]
MLILVMCACSSVLLKVIPLLSLCCKFSRHLSLSLSLSLPLARSLSLTHTHTHTHTIYKFQRYIMHIMDCTYIMTTVIHL